MTRPAVWRVLSVTTVAALLVNAGLLLTGSASGPDSRQVQDRAFLFYAYKYGLNRPCPRPLVEENTQSCIDAEIAEDDGRGLCSNLTYRLFGPPEQWRPEYSHAGTFTSYTDGRATWLAATRVYCPQFLGPVHGAYLARGAPAYHGPKLHVPPDPLPYDYPRGGLCILRARDWPGFAQACPNPIP
jgi:hypothetical protein